MDGWGNYRLIRAIYTNPIRATVVQPPSILLTLHHCPILPTLPTKMFCVAYPNRVTLREPISPAARPFVPPVVVEDKSQGWQKFWSKISPAKIFARAASGISTSGFILMKVKGIGSNRIQKDAWVGERIGLDRMECSR